jgi:hypothetical protein
VAGGTSDPEDALVSPGTGVIPSGGVGSLEPPSVVDEGFVDDFPGRTQMLVFRSQT